MRPKTWKARFFDARTPDGFVELQCPRCERDAQVPTCGRPGALLIAAIGLALIFDPPNHKPPAEWLPDELECRGCGAVFCEKEPA